MKMCSCLAAAALLVVSGAETASAGGSGSFRLLESAVHDYTAMKHAGRTVTAGPLRGTATIVDSSGGPFAEGGHYNLLCVVYAKKSDSAIELEAPCTLTDSSGDELYLLARRSAGDVEVAGGGSGSQAILGGTGKYRGVTGECPYTTGYLPDKWLVSTGTCAWRGP